MRSSPSSTRRAGTAPTQTPPRETRKRRSDQQASAALDLFVLRAWLGQLARTCKPSSVARKIASVRSLVAPRAPDVPLRGRCALVVESPDLETVANRPATTSVERVRREAVVLRGPRAARGALRRRPARRPKRAASTSISSRSTSARARDRQRAGRSARSPWAQGVRGPSRRGSPRAPRSRTKRTRFIDPKSLFLSTRGRRLNTRAMQLLVRRYGLAGAGRADLHTARAPPHVRDAPARRRRRSPRHPGDAGPRLALDDPAVHARPRWRTS